MKFLDFSRVLLAVIVPTIVNGIKIAFVGDTGMEDESSYGYGLRTMEMIEDEEVDLVVDVGDFDYWGRCTETFQVRDLLTIDSLTGRNVEVPNKSTLKRLKWQDGRHGSVEGWEIGIQPASDSSESAISKRLTVNGDLFQRHVISHEAWKDIEDDLRLQSGERNCYGEPWDGPWSWNQFLRDHSFDFLGASGNAEVKEAPLYGSAEIWSSHQQYLHKLYIERIYDSNRGACHGYIDQTEPGSVDEYGERFSCYYNNNRGKEEFQFLFLGWWQGSNERADNKSKEDRKKTIDFIEREFGDKRSQKVRWRFCIHHMTSAKLSSGGKDRDNMILAHITDACRKHGAIIISGHHHIYSRTKMLQSVGSDGGEDPIPVDGAETDASNLVISEGVTMSITTGMGGFDGGCNGKYWNATWMHNCIARPSDHRGAVIAEFTEKNTRIGNFRYMNSMKNGNVVDEFQIISRLPGSRTKAPTNIPSTQPTRKPTRKPTKLPTKHPTESPTESQIIGYTNEPTHERPEPNTQKPIENQENPTLRPSPRPSREPSPKPTQKAELDTKEPTKNEEKPTARPSPRPSREPSPKPTPKAEPDTKEPTENEKKPTARPSPRPSREPSPKPSQKAEPDTRKPAENESGPLDEGCISAMDYICSNAEFLYFCELVNRFDLVDWFSPVALTSLTVFVPVNEAFEVLKGNKDFDLYTLPSKQSIYVLLAHIITKQDNLLHMATQKDNVVTYDDLICGQLTEMANGENTRTKCSDEKKFQKGPSQIDDRLPEIIVSNIDVCEGIIHVIDNIILPNLGKVQ